MTSKRKLRAEIERLRVSRAGYRTALLDAAAECTCPALGVATPAVQKPWAAHLARVTDAAREQGRREGYRQALADMAADVALLRDMDHQPQPETTPEPAGGCQADVSPDGPCCGFACCCQHPPVAGWAPGSVTR